MYLVYRLVVTVNHSAQLILRLASFSFDLYNNIDRVITLADLHLDHGSGSKNGAK